MQNMPKDERWAAREMAALAKRVAALETATRAGHTSISSGSLVVRDTDTGEVLGSISAGEATDDDGVTIPAGVSASVGDIDGAVLRDGSVDESKVSFSIEGGGITSTVGPAPGVPLNANPGFDASLAGWTGGGGTLTRDTATFHSGTAAAKIVPDGVSANATINSSQIPVTPATVYQAFGWLRCAVARTLMLNVNWFTAAGVYITTSSGPVTVAANTWTPAAKTVTAPAGAALATIVPTVTGTPPATNVLLADDIVFAAPGVGDLWVDTSHGNVVNRWDGAAWQPLPVGTDAIQAGSITGDLIAANTITAGQLAAGIIDGETITGATIVADSAGGGVFVYAGTPAAGNLAVALAPADGVDAYGNVVGQGVTVAGYMVGDTATAVSLQPANVGGSTFAPAQIFARTASDGEGDLVITSPMDTSRGSDTSNIIMRGSDAVGGSSLALDAETLLFGGGQDYQSWVPTVAGNGSATVSTRDGWYVQFGDLIFFNAYVQFSAAGVSTDTTNITMTLPVTPFRGSANRRQVYTGYLSAAGTGGTNGPLACVTLAGGSTGIDQIVMDTGTALQGRHLGVSSIITVQGIVRRA